jgi:hypothetical protein
MFTIKTVIRQTIHTRIFLFLAQAIIAPSIVVACLQKAARCAVGYLARGARNSFIARISVGLLVEENFFCPKAN